MLHILYKYAVVYSIKSFGHIWIDGITSVDSFRPVI